MLKNENEKKETALAGGLSVVEPEMKNAWITRARADASRSGA